MSQGWIGVDLDGTLAQYDGWRGIHHIGQPVPAMLNRVRQWIAEGKYEVRIFTARVGEGPEQVSFIQDWLESLGLPRLQVTATKDFEMIELWDDRCVAVESNTGRVLGGGQL